MPKTIFTEEHKVLVSKIRNARLSSGMNQAEVSKKLGVSQSYLSKLETGQIRIEAIQLKRIANFYKKSLSYFIK